MSRARVEEEETEREEMAIVNLKFLSCSMCFNPLHHPPLFKCIHGHMVCESCKDRKMNRCHICNCMTYCSRTDPLVKILETARVFCPNRKYGCNALVPHYEKHEHKKTCSFFPCSCPEELCEYSCTAREMKDHLITVHGCSVHNFHYDMNFEVSISDQPKCKILAANQDDCIFILETKIEQFIGMTLSLLCIRPTGMVEDELEFWYDMVVYEESTGRRIVFFSASVSGSTLEQRAEDSKAFVLLSDKHILSSANVILSICIKPV